jgi:hypothetical protein
MHSNLLTSLKINVWRSVRIREALHSSEGRTVYNKITYAILFIRREMVKLKCGSDALKIFATY